MCLADPWGVRMKSGFPFSRALAAWKKEGMRGPLLVVVFVLLGAAVASSGELSYYQAANCVVESAGTCSPLSKRPEFFIHISGNALTDIGQGTISVLETQKRVWIWHTRRSKLR